MIRDHITYKNTLYIYVPTHTYMHTYICTYAHNVLNANDVHCVVGPCRQTCSGGCIAQHSQKINVTVPNSVIIPCGDLMPSPNNTVDYCNFTNSVNERLHTGVTTQYNLTPTEPSHDNNIIYCTNNQDIACYMLTAFCKELIIYCSHILHVVITVMFP